MKNSIFEDWDRLVGGDINSEIIISGSSRGMVSYDPSIFMDHTGRTTFNLSFDGAPHNLQYVKLDLYLQNNHPPEIFIQNIDIAHLSELHTVPFSYQMIPVLNEKNLLKEFRSLDSHFYQFDDIPLLKYNNYVPLLYKGIYSHLDKDYSIATTEKGFVAVNKSYQVDSGNLSRIKKEDSTNQSIENYRNGINSTFTFLENNIPPETKIFLVWAPEYKIRLELSENLRQSLKKEINTFTKGRKNVYFLDFSADPISQDVSNFYDSFHLNAKGAKLFSEKAAKEVAAILKKKSENAL